MNAFDDAPNGFTYEHSLFRIETDQGVEGIAAAEATAAPADTAGRVMLSWKKLSKPDPLSGKVPLAVRAIKTDDVTGETITRDVADRSGDLRLGVRLGQNRQRAA